MKKKDIKKYRIKNGAHKSVIKIIPNTITTLSMCFGLTSIYFGLSSNWQYAISCILIAGILDGIDGKIARLLKSASEFGAEFDSLADLVNFGVCPAMILYLYKLHYNQRSGWALCLFFTICMAFRLARFNISRSQPTSGLYSIGLPAPAAAILLLFPIILESILEIFYIPKIFYSINALIVSILMISKLPTFVFKKINIEHSYALLIMVSIVAIIVSLFAAPWHTIASLITLYIFSIPLSCILHYKQKNIKRTSVNDFLKEIMHK